MTQAMLRRALWPALLALPVLASTTLGSASLGNGSEDAPVSDDDVHVFNDHLVTLASPFMEGRLPGTRGMEIAKEYMQFYMEKSGLEPAFGDGEKSYRQAFPLAATPELKDQDIAIPGETFTAGKDYTALSMSGSTTAKGDLVFVGYSIEKGDKEYTSFPNDEKLDGKVAVLLRFEPMNAEGKSLWADEGWSRHAGYSTKVRAAAKRGAAGVIMINPPGAADDRINQLLRFRGGGRGLEVPVLMLSVEAGEKLIREATGGGRTLLDLRKHADEGGAPVELDLEVTLNVDIERKTLNAENVGGLLKGRGELADELVVVGAHLDHLGMGNFGSRSGAGELHPGADDNASGSAAILMIADKLKKAYEELPADKPLRSVLFLAFSAEESGLNGAKHYVENPIVPIEDHALMINFDMIGRITNKRLMVAGTKTGKGLEKLLYPIYDDCGLEIVRDASIPGGSDHMMFWQKEVPALFSIIADFHDDYHTPRDTSALINRVDAVRTVNLFYDVTLAVAQAPERWPYERLQSGASRARLGIRSGGYDRKLKGIKVASVSDAGAAAEAGFQEGDVITTWNNEPVESLISWRRAMREHKPGDVIPVSVLRGEEKMDIEVKLKGR